MIRRSINVRSRPAKMWTSATDGIYGIEKLLVVGTARAQAELEENQMPVATEQSGQEMLQPEI